EARSARLLGGRPGVRGARRQRGRRDRSRRCARRWLSRRRARAGARGCDALRLEARSHAVTFLDVSEEVREALAAGGAVVALETTLVAHGFPAPEGVAVA